MRIESLPVVPVLLGPTAVGKTDLALELCHCLGYELLSCDSRQVYKGMDIGTAKPTLAQREMVRHWLVDTLDPNEPYSAYRFALDAQQVIYDRAQSAKRMLICGGTGFYFKALSQGLNLGAPPDEKIRLDLRDRLQRQGAQSIFEELQAHDPTAAARIHPHDAQRILRALEMCYTASGSPVGADSVQKDLAAQPIQFKVILLVRDRDELYQRINCRVDSMVGAGLLEEFRSLLVKGYGEHSAGLLSPGYREWFEFERSELTLEQTCEKIKRSTRHFAKRQLTWFRTQVQGTIINLSGISPASASARLKAEFAAD